jgi:hypothetical protein
MNKKDTLNNKKIYAFASIALFAVIGATLLIISRAATPSTNPDIVSLAATGSASLSVSPNSSSYATNSTFVSGVFVDSGSQAINGINVKMSYNASQLEVVSVVSTGTSFAACPSSSGANGTIALVCYVAPPNTLTGKNLIANVTFKVKASSGTSVISFVRESDLVSKIALAGTGENIWDGVASGGSYTLGSTTTPPSGTGNTTTPSTTGGSSSNPTSGTSGGSKTTPKTSTSTNGGSSPAGTTTSPTTTTTDGTTITEDTTSGAAGGTATSTATKLNTNAIIMYAAIVGGVIVLISASGVTFARFQRKKKFNRAHGIGNTAVVFDANTSVHNPQTNSIDQGPIVPSSTPATPVQTNGPQGNIITPNNDVKPQ